MFLLPSDLCGLSPQPSPPTCLFQAASGLGQRGGQLQGPGSWRAAPLSRVLCLSLLQLLQSQDVKEDAVLCCSMEVSVSDLRPSVPPTPSTCGQWRITLRTHKSWARVCRRGWWGMAS